jgi:ankyrin repeat protein
VNQEPLNHLVAPAQMMVAVMDGDFERCKNLIQRGADISTMADSWGRTPLQEAAERGYTELCRLFLENGAVADQPAKDGTTALHYAAMRGSVDICRLLVAHGADVAHVRPYDAEEKYTSLQLAVINGHKEVVRFFVEECGEDLEQYSHGGKTLIALAQRFAHSELAAFLESYGRAMKTERAIHAELPVYDPAASPARSRGLSPL